MIETTTPTPEGAASTPPPDAPVRGSDGKFVSQAQPQPETPEATPDAAQAAEYPQEGADKRDEPKRNRAADRINQLTAEKHAAMREADALRQQLEAMQKAPRPQVDPNDYEATQRESVRGVFREEAAQQTATQMQAAIQRVQEAQLETFSAKVDAARERIPDIDRSLTEFYKLPVSTHAGEIIVDSEVAAEMAHYLANNPREAFDIYQMTPAQQGRALARIEAKVTIPSRKTSSAPPPPPMVTGAQATRDRSPGEMSAAEYVAMRKQQWAKGGR